MLRQQFSAARLRLLSCSSVQCRSVSQLLLDSVLSRAKASLLYQGSMKVKTVIPKTTLAIEYKLKGPCLLSRHSEDIRMQFVGQIL